MTPICASKLYQSLVQIMICRLFPRVPMVYCKLDDTEHISVKFYLKFTSFNSLPQCVNIRNVDILSEAMVFCNISMHIRHYMAMLSYYLAFVGEICQSLVDSPHKRPGKLAFDDSCVVAGTNCSTNDRVSGDLRALTLTWRLNGNPH